MTLEDILEELVGEIEDEFDARRSELVRRDGGAAIVDGATPIRELERELGVEIGDPHEATVGGHLLELLGRLPAAGETVELDGLRAEVARVDETRILELRITPRPQR